MILSRISSWGRLSNNIHRIDSSLNLDDKLTPLPIKKTLVFGNGRSYGDVCLNQKGILFSSKHLDRFIQFDSKSGILVCESGILLKEIQKVVVPRGWILAVTPGTQLITIGGAIANDIHGKNHHKEGTFCHHIKQIKLIRTNGRVILCGPKLNSQWFAATVGGLGLTGIISEVTIQLKRMKSPWISSETIPFSNLEEFFRLSQLANKKSEYVVAWIDCLSAKNLRGIFTQGNVLPSPKNKAPSLKRLAIPFSLPFSLVNRLTLKPFNLLYYFFQKMRSGKHTVYYESFLYPLDSIKHWNRMYGPKGFYQYQVLIPRNKAKSCISQLLEEIRKSGQGSFLAVLKFFGNKKSLGLLSFAGQGVTLALDFPNKGKSTLELFNRLDLIIKNAGGKIYLAKDARMTKDFFEKSYKNFEIFKRYRDPGIASELSERLMGE